MSQCDPLVADAHHRHEPDALPGRPAWVDRAQTLPSSDEGRGLGTGDRHFQADSQRR